MVDWQHALTQLDQHLQFEISLGGHPQRELLLELFSVADSTDIEPGIGVLLRDVTEERDLERTKDELVSVVSHELHTPLGSLVGFAELLVTRDFAEPERREFLGVMVQEGRRLTPLINDFLDLQRMEECRQQNSLRALDVGSVLESSSAADGAVLVVEDDIRFARLLAAELAVHGLSAVRVTSAEAALDRLASARPRAGSRPRPARPARRGAARSRGEDRRAGPTCPGPDDEGSRRRRGAAVIRKGPDAAARAAAALAHVLADSKDIPEGEVA